MASTESTEVCDVDSGNQLTNAEAPSGFILKLFQMVNGAPDEIITWTPSGDAFVIGSDLKRLESETLPQYFRHNRFQSLVRQLNFYSFRKINRERNTWVYKHSLFHRDRPEDLHLVRRRTCPGLDGRKQRFARFTSRKPNQSDSDAKSDDESSSVESQKAEQVAIDNPPPKRHLDFLSSAPPPPNKRTRRLRSAELPVKEEEPTTVVDDSLLEAAPPDMVGDGEDSYNLIDTRGDKVEMMEQSMIVSEVAVKLEQFVRKAMKKGRSRKGSSGMVTPPYGSLHNFSASTVLTYDDEDYGYESDELNSGRGSSSSSVGVVTPSESSSVGDEASLPGDALLSPSKLKSPPVEDSEMVEAITRRLFAGSPPHSRALLKSQISIANFCMSTAPIGDVALCSKILQLIASCNTLSTDFQKYRAALHPVRQATFPSFPLAPNTPRFHAVTIQQIWERTASRSDAVRDFKIFAVNCIHKILGKGDLHSTTIVSPNDRAVLKRTADVWQKSTGQVS